MPETRTADGHQSPPKTFWGVLTRIGPGLIIAGSIVGSGELIATTKTGAEAGFWLLWLILIGCIIKVFVQVELGRYTISSGETTMLAMNHLPGPRLKRRGNWVIWYWFIMFVASIAQLGGIVGGVGQALAISAPLTTEARAYNQVARLETKVLVDVAELRQAVAREAQEGGGDEIDLKSKSFLTTLTALNDQYASVEFFYEYLLNQPDKSLEELMEEEEAGEDDDGQAQDPLAPIELNINERRADLRSLLDNLLQARTRLEDYAAAPMDAAAGSDPGEGNPQIEADRTWVEENLATLQEQLVKLYELESVSDQIRQQRKALAQAESKADAAKITAERQKLRDLIDTENDLAVAAYDRDAKLGFGGGLKLTDTFITYKSEAQWKPPIDDKIWAAIVAIVTSLILMNGRFGLIQSFSTAMVACFTLITIVNLILLSQNPSWAVSYHDIVDGMRFRLPPADASGSALSTALKTFGIIGVGASELVAYPYWCLEKGYARFTGPNDDSQEWVDRAKGWMRVMRVDAWGSMIIYTFATMAFYLLGASVLGRTGLNPESHNLVRYLSVMYEPVFGTTTEMLFLFGCFAVLYSTFFVANAGHARVFADSLRVLGIISVSAKSYTFWVRFFSGLFPIICLVIYIYIPRPAYLVLLSGLMQAIMLPMLAATALFLRYRQIDKRLAPSIAWDIFLWISSVGMLIAGGWAAWTELSKLL